MKLTAFEDSVKGTDLDVPFLNEFLKTNKFTEPQLVVLIKETDKGLILFGTQFKVFVWNSEELLGWVLNIIQESLNDSSVASGLYLLSHPESKRRCLIARDEESQGAWTALIPRAFTYTLHATPTVQGDILDSGKKQKR